VTIGELAAIIAAGAWALLVLALVILSVRLFQILTETRLSIEGIREQAVPLLSEVRTSVVTMNKNLEHSDDLMVSVGNITRTVDQFVSTPLIKGLSIAYGARQASRRFRGR
jgi:Bacterial protein of unknown function (DUF948)